MPLTADSRQTASAETFQNLAKASVAAAPKEQAPFTRAEMGKLDEFIQFVADKGNRKALSESVARASENTQKMAYSEANEFAASTANSKAGEASRSV